MARIRNHTRGLLFTAFLVLRKVFFYILICPRFIGRGNRGNNMRIVHGETFTYGATWCMRTYVSGDSRYVEHRLDSVSFKRIPMLSLSSSPFFDALHLIHSGVVRSHEVVSYDPLIFLHVCCQRSVSLYPVSFTVVVLCNVSFSS